MWSRRRTLFWGICLGILLQGAIGVLAADNSAPTKDQMLELEILGNERIPGSVIEKELSFQVGQHVETVVIEQNIRRLKAMGIFSEVTYKEEFQKLGKKVIITVSENPMISEIRVEGNIVHSRAKIIPLLQSKSGQLLSLSAVRNDVQIIEQLYQDQGYFLARVAQVKTPEKLGDPLVFMIAEGHLEEVLVTGNTKTQEHVILREMDGLKPGMAINTSLMRKEVSKVFNLNYFNQVIPDFIPGDKPDTYKMLVAVDERSTGTLNIGGGYGQVSGLFIYSDLNVDNLFGTGQLVALKGQWGSNNDYYQFKYHNPWMWDNRKSFTFRMWLTRGATDYNNFALSQFQSTRKGFDMAVGWPISYELSTQHRIKVEDVDVPEDSTHGISKDHYYIHSYTFNISDDTRDVRFNPLSGHYHILSIERGLELNSESLNFTKYDLTLQNFHKTFDKQTIATRLLVGWMNGQLQPAEIYYIGGPNTVRGYQQYPNAFAQGNQRAILNLEYRFLFSDMFQALLFIDAGWANSFDRLDEARIGKGFGFRVQSPLGPIRLDFGIDDSDTMLIHFNIGNVF